MRHHCKKINLQPTYQDLMQNLSEKSVAIYLSKRF